MKKGFVALIGAGPGEAGLMTIRGKEYLDTAEVVVYDRLVSDAILTWIPETALKIDVGKESSHHKVPQEQINEILLREALLGKKVVRLKGGDPFLFGRGGEELDLLVQHEIPFEVVPGITSAIAVPAYAGIPVTHRDYCSSVHIITGHQRDNEALKIDFDALRRTEGTLVFLMGIASLKQIMDGLLQADMDQDTPAAIIEKGTTVNQRVIVGTIRNLHEKAMTALVKSPAIIVVGKVCGLSTAYDWFSKRELFGTTIMVTRPKVSGNALSQGLKDLGATVIDYPCIDIKSLPDNGCLLEAIHELQNYQWLVFTSKSGVRIFFQALKSRSLDTRYLGSLKIAAVGSQTARSLEEVGIIADYVPEVFDGRHLGEGLVKRLNKDEKVLILRAKKGTEDILNILENERIAYEDVPIYETVYENQKSEEICTMIQEGQIDFVTFTSQSTVEGFVRSMQGADFSKVKGICIGEQTAKSAREAGIQLIVSEEATIPSMIHKILEVQHGKHSTS